MEIFSAEVDFEAVYVALDRKRRHAGLTRAELCRLLGYTPMVFTRWGQGVRMSGTALLRACLWLDTDLRQFALKVPAPQKE